MAIILWKSICISFDGNHFMEIILWFHMLVGAEQAREVVTLVTSEAPFSKL